MGGTTRRYASMARHLGGKVTEGHCRSRVSRVLPSILLAAACVAASASSCGGSGSPGRCDAPVHKPPTSGPFAYNSFVPPPTQGSSYVDPVFGTTVRRITADHINDDLYARNMWWSADDTRYLHRTTNGTAFKDFWDVIDVATGKVTHKGIPIGGVEGGAGPFASDGGFDPVEPNVLYALGPTTVYKITLNADGTWTGVAYFTPPGGAPLKSLGGTLNWLDASGRYMVVRYGDEPSVHLYDRQNLAAGPYANPVNGASTIDKGHYVGITPDGQYLVGYQDGGAYDLGQGVSWKIDHENRAIAPSPTIFWSLAGDHAAFVSASDGRNYMIAYNAVSGPQLWRVDITNNADGLKQALQRVLPNNKLLRSFTTWNDTSQFATAAPGPFQDWSFVSTEDGTDTLNGSVRSWHAFRQEIFAINVITGEIRRLAHHRSRADSGDYFSQPRVSASWRGRYVGFASNFNQSRVNDIYVIPFSATSGTSASPVSSTPPSREQALPEGAPEKARGR